MIKPLKNTDIRIGNYIQSGNNGRYYLNGSIGRVLSIGNDEQSFEQVYCECDESFDWYFKDNYFGIVLTKEHLFLFGFTEKKGKQDIYIKGRLVVWLGHGGFLSYLKNEDSDESYFIPNHDLLFVHQLQNLYWSLTNDELINDEILKENETNR
jgi:hypothetical protein